MHFNKGYNTVICIFLIILILIQIILEDAAGELTVTLGHRRANKDGRTNSLLHILHTGGYWHK